jgi:hypothetical protein
MLLVATDFTGGPSLFVLWAFSPNVCFSSLCTKDKFAAEWLYGCDLYRRGRKLLAFVGGFSWVILLGFGGIFGGFLLGFVICFLPVGLQMGFGCL